MSTSRRLPAYPARLYRCNRTAFDDGVVDFAFEVSRHLVQRDTAAPDQPHAPRRGEPGIAVAVNSDTPNIIVREPSKTLSVLPRFAIETDRTAVCPEPNHSVLSGGNSREVVVRQAAVAGVQRPLSLLENSRSLRTRKPQSAARVKYSSANVTQLPADVPLIRINLCPGTRWSLEEQTFRRGGGSRPVARGRTLADVFQPGDQGRICRRRASHPLAVLESSRSRTRQRDDAIVNYQHTNYIVRRESFTRGIELPFLNLKRANADTAIRSAGNGNSRRNYRP